MKLNRSKIKLEYPYCADYITGGTFQYAYNILVNLDGTISMMPFDTKRSGLWYFDGQVFYQKLEFFESQKGKL